MISSAKTTDSGRFLSTPQGGVLASSLQNSSLLSVTDDSMLKREHNASTSSLQIMDFGEMGQIYAITARMAGRLNAANVSQREHEDLLKERQCLLDKQFSDEISRKDVVRLEYVRWSLDRIEDAKHGQELDALETLAVQYEQFLTNIKEFEAQLGQHSHSRKLK